MMRHICVILRLTTTIHLFCQAKVPESCQADAAEEEAFVDFERLYTPPKAGSHRIPCTREQIDTDESCILPPSLVSVSVKPTFFSDTFDYFLQSNWIDQIVYLRQIMMAQNNKTANNKTSRLETISKETPISFFQMQDILIDNVDILRKAKEVGVNAVDGCYEGTSSLESVSNHQKLVDRLFYKICDDEESIKSLSVHAITVNHRLKRVDVIFSGSKANNWKQGLSSMIGKKRSMDNPVKQLNATLPKIIIQHSCYKALVVGGSSATNAKKHKYEEILDDVEAIMPDGYQLFVTGRSFGGATATLFGFFAAAASDERFTRHGPVVVFSFNSPRVGADVSFRKVFQWLEERGRIRHARIHDNKHPWIVGGSDKHVGLEIRLDDLNEPPIINYPVSERPSQKLPDILFVAKSLLRSKNNCFKMCTALSLSEKAFNSTSLGEEYEKVWSMQDQQTTYQYSDLNQSFIDRDAVKLRDILANQPALASVMDENGWTILHEIARAPEGFYDTLKFIFENGIADVNARNGGDQRDGDTLLDVTKRFQDDQREDVHQEVAHLLVSQGAKSSYDLDFEKYHPMLLRALSNRDHRTVADILKIKPELQFPFRVDPNGWTILHEAVRTGDLKTVHVVLEVGGADVNARVGKEKKQGSSVLDIALDRLPGGKDNDIAKYLISQGAKSSLDIEIAQYTTRDLAIALVEKKDDAFRSILEARPDLVSLEDENGWTILHEVVRAGNFELVRFLIENANADVHARAGKNEEQDVIDIANKFLNEDHDVVRYLNGLEANSRKEAV